MGWLRKAIYPAFSPDGPLPYPHWRAPPRLRIRILPKVLQRCKFLRDNKSTYLKSPKSGNGYDSFSFQDRPTVLHTGTLQPVSITLQYALTMVTAPASSNTHFFCLLSIHSIPSTYFTWNQQTTGQMYFFLQEKVSQAPTLQKAQTP